MKPATDSTARRRLGEDGERAARAWLEAGGLRCLDAGWHCRLGELDLVMTDGEVLVFVEVRARAAGNIVNALDSVDAGKQRRFVRAARAWLATHPETADMPARFDIVTFDGEQKQWLRDAFSVAAW